MNFDQAIILLTGLVVVGSIAFMVWYENRPTHRCATPLAARYGAEWSCACGRTYVFGSYPGALPGGMWRQRLVDESSSEDDRST
jgi:hypothetical protein